MANRSRATRILPSYDAGDKVGCPVEWAVAKERCTRAMMWSAHWVKGLENYYIRSPPLYGHFSEIVAELE